MDKLWPEVTLDDLDLIIQEYNKEIDALVNKLPTKIKFYKYKYMILYIYNKLYETQMNELKLFRESQGHQVITYLVSENDHYFSIKNYIDNLYNTNNNLKYILIFGNIEDVPTLMKSGTGESSLSNNFKL